MILLDPTARPIIAHRGASAYAPENTLGAFQRAVDLGADAIEFDVRATADGVPVVIHDATLDRTTDISGWVRALPLTRIREANASHHFPSAPPATIPTLQEVLTAFPNLPMLVEIKEADVQGAVAELLLKHGAAERCVVASEDHKAIEAFRRPPFHAGASRRDIARLYFGTLLGIVPRAVRYRCLSVPVDYRGLRVPTRRFVDSARKLGCPVHVWTVNDRIEAERLWRAGVCGIVTNRPDVMKTNP